MWQLAHQLADILLKLLVQCSVVARILQHAQKLAQRVLPSAKGSGIERRAGPDDDSFDPGRFLTESQGSAPRLGKKMFSRSQQAIVDVGSADQFDAAREEPAVCVARYRVFDRQTHAIDRLCNARTPVNRNRHLSPAHDVAGNRNHFGKFAILDRNDVRTLGADLANVATLEIAREDHVRSLVENGRLMHMTESPVMVSLIDKVIERTGGIVGVTPHTAQTRMEHANVEYASNWLRVSRH